MITEEEVYKQTREDLSGDHGEEQRLATMIAIAELQLGQSLDMSQIRGVSGVKVTPDSAGGYLINQKR